VKWRTWQSPSSSLSPHANRAVDQGHSECSVERICFKAVLFIWRSLWHWKSLWYYGVKLCVDCLPDAYINWVCHDFWPCHVSNSGRLFRIEVLGKVSEFPTSTISLSIINHARTYLGHTSWVWPFDMHEVVDFSKLQHCQ